MKIIILLCAATLLAGCGNNSTQSQSNTNVPEMSTNTSYPATNGLDTNSMTATTNGMDTNSLAPTNDVGTNTMSSTNEMNTNSMSSTNAQR